MESFLGCLNGGQLMRMTTREVLALRRAVCAMGTVG